MTDKNDRVRDLRERRDRATDPAEREDLDRQVREAESGAQNEQNPQAQQ